MWLLHQCAMSDGLRCTCKSQPINMPSPLVAGLHGLCAHQTVNYRKSSCSCYECWYRLSLFLRTKWRRERESKNKHYWLTRSNFEYFKENSFKVWSIKRAIKIQTYDAHDPVPVPLNIIYNIGKLPRLAGRKNKKEVGTDNYRLRDSWEVRLDQ